MVNLQEGGRRMKAAGLNALKIGVGIAVLNVIITVVFTYTDAAFYTKYLPSGIVSIMLTAAAYWLVVLGAMLAVAGWIVQGFGMPREPKTTLPNLTDIPVPAEP
jgi:hypothetical protein